MTFRLISRLIKTSDNFITNNIINKTLSIILMIYIIFIIPNMLNYSDRCTYNIILMFNNCIFKLLIYLLIGYIAQSNIQLSIFMTIALIISFNAIIKYEFNQNLINILIKDQINKKELEIKKINKETSNKQILKEPSKESSKEQSIKESSNKQSSKNLFNNFETYNNDNINNFSYLE